MIPVMTTPIHHRPRKRNTNNSMFEIRFVALSGFFYDHSRCYCFQFSRRSCLAVVRTCVNFNWHSPHRSRRVVLHKVDEKIAR